MAYYIGIDLGTSSVKVILTDAGGNLLHADSEPIESQRPQAGWSEQNPEDWLKATLTVLDRLHAAAPHLFKEVISIGLSGHMHGLTLIDSNGRVLRPAILWNDTRSQQECRELEARHPEFISRTGNRIMPGFTAPKVAWVLKHEPHLRSKIDKVLLPKDYLRWRLTGEFFSDMSDAAGTLWLDVKERRWSQTLLGATGLSLSHMPELVDGTAPAGQLSQSLTDRWKMSRTPLFAGGAGDNAASACAMGAVATGDTFLSLGTSGVLWMTLDQFMPIPEQGLHTFCHALPGKWHNMAVILSAMDSLQWFGKIVGKHPQELTKNSEALAGKTVKALFLPYLSGERTPHNNADAAGAFVGLTQNQDLDDLTVAVLEGVGFALKDCLKVLSMNGLPIHDVPLIGGGSRIPGYAQMLANILEIPVLLPAGGDLGAAFGAVRLGIAAADGGNLPAHFTKPPIAKTLYPQAAAFDYYREKYHRFTELYEPLHTKT